MKEILLCASAFSISMIISDAHLFAESIPTINKQNYSLMECESLYGIDYSIYPDSGQVKAAAECFLAVIILWGQRLSCEIASCRNIAKQVALTASRKQANKNQGSFI